jgi:hypothetical protein
MMTAQLSFSPLPFGHSRPHVRLDEVAKVLGVTNRHALDLLESDEFRGIPINDSDTVKRVHMRILRSTVEAWWLERWLQTHGEEYPFQNSPEHTWWRQKLREKRTCVPAPLSAN